MKWTFLILTPIICLGLISSAYAIEGYDYKRQITTTSNASAGTTVPCYVNTTSGFDLGTPSGNQFVWTQCTVGATDNYLYYNNNADYIVANETLDTQQPMDVRFGNSSSYNPTDVWDLDGLRAWYSFDDNSNDSRQEFNGGVENDIVYTDTLFHRGLDSNTSNSLRPPDSALVSGDINNNFTVCLWFQQTGPPTTTERIVSIRQNVGSLIDMNFLMGTTNVSSSCFREGDGVYTCLTASGDYSQPTGWHHFCYVKTAGDSVRAYWDGGNTSGGEDHELSGLGKTLGYGSNRVFCIGANGQGCNTAGFHGDIDEVSYWNVSLTEDEVIGLYNQGTMATLGAEQSGKTECDSCSSCQTEITNANAGDTVYMNQSIGGANCINWGGKDGVTLDCQGYNIAGSSTYAVQFSGGDDNIIHNCSMTGSSQRLIYALNSQNNTVRYSTFNGATIHIFQIRRTTGGPYEGWNVHDNEFTGGPNNNLNAMLHFDLQFTPNNFTNNIVNVNGERLGLRAGGINPLIDNNTFVGDGTPPGTYFSLGMRVEQDNAVITNNNFSNIQQAILWEFTPDNALVYNNLFDVVTPSNNPPGTGHSFNTTKTLGTNIIGGSYLGGNYWNGSDTADNTGDGLGDTPVQVGSSSFYDYLPLTTVTVPLVDFVSPTPANGSMLSQDYIFVNVSNPYLNYDTCILEWNGINESMTVSGTMCYLNKTGLTTANNDFRVYANATSYSDLNSSELRTVILVFPVSVVIESPVNGQSYSITFGQTTYSLPIDYSTENAIACWYDIGSGNTTLPLCDNTTLSLATGSYSITIYANNTLGEEASDSATFTVAEPTMNLLPFPWNLVAGVIISAGFILYAMRLFFSDKKKIKPKDIIYSVVGLIIVAIILGVLFVA